MAVLTRRVFPFLAYLVASVAILCYPAPAASQESAASGRPNVLFIIIDDLNDWVGVLKGHPQAHTPHIDRLAATGVTFTNAHAPAPACNPSRTAMLFGRWPTSTGVYANEDSWPEALAGAASLQQAFQSAGYRTLRSGEVFHAPRSDLQDWTLQFPASNLAKPKNPLPEGRPLNGIPKTAQFDWGRLDVASEKMSDHQVAAWAAKQLEEDQPESFFLAIGFTGPHLPWYVPAEYFQRFPLETIQLPEVIQNDLEDVPPAGVALADPRGDHRAVVEAGEWKDAVQGYLASIAFLDEQVGRVLDALRKSKYARNTLVVLASDQGFHLGEKQHWRKFSLWEDATRVPLIITIPGMKSAGSTCRQPASLVDLYPTLVDLCSLSAPDRLDGRSLRLSLSNPQAPVDRPALTVHGAGNYALRTVEYRYIRYADGGEELYDHRTDPHEWRNLATEPSHQSIKAQLARYFPMRKAPRPQ